MLIESEHSEPAAPAPFRVSVLGKSRVAAGEVLAVTKAEISAYNRAYHQSHRAERIAYERAQRAEIAARQRAYRISHKAELKASDKARHQAHRAEGQAHDKAYYQSHKAKKVAYSRAYRQSHKAAVHAYQVEYERTHPGRKTDIEARRRAAKRGCASETISRARVYDRDAGRCHICGKKVRPGHWHLDHIIPLARGGEHSYKNVAVCHPSCNMRKHARLVGQLRLL